MTLRLPRKIMPNRSTTDKKIAWEFIVRSILVIVYALQFADIKPGAIAMPGNRRFIASGMLLSHENQPEVIHVTSRDKRVCFIIMMNNPLNSFGVGASFLYLRNEYYRTEYFKGKEFPGCIKVDKVLNPPMF